MSEDQELLARIGQLAGQINLHKTQPSSSQTTALEQANARSSGSSVLRGHTAWKPQRPAPYQVAPGRGRGAYRPYSRNRSLVVNSGAGHSPSPRSLDPSTSVSIEETPQTESAYVTTTGRHKQYINASVLAKVTEQRKRAIEESQQLKMQKHDQWERQRLQRYVAALDAEQSKSLAQGSQHTSDKTHEIDIDGLRFQVLKGGSKLVRIFGPTDTSRATPKRANVQGVTFVRSKQGNLYRSGVVRASKTADKAKKTSSLCKSFTKTGHCNKGPACLYHHNPATVAICSTYLQKGTCPAGDSCDLSHEATPERVPACIHFLRGKCSNPSCRYAHVRVNPSAPVCKSFATMGYCGKGADCSNRHVHECPDYANTGTCRKKKCDLPHVDRAGQIRKHAAQSVDAGVAADNLKSSNANDSDLSSEEDDYADTDGDDVDSDDLEDEILVGVNDPGNQELAQQNDFVQLLGQ